MIPLGCKNPTLKHVFIKYLDETNVKAVPLEWYFLDLDKFMMSVIKVPKIVGYDVPSKQKRFCLKKHLTAIRKKKKKDGLKKYGKV